MYIDSMILLLACLRLLLKAPRLTADIRNLAFSSYFNGFSARFSVKASIRTVSSCIFVKLLFSESIFAIGSSRERFSHFRVLSWRCSNFTNEFGSEDTVLYTG